MAKSLFHAWLILLGCLAVLTIFHPVGTCAVFLMTAIWHGENFESYVVDAAMSKNTLSHTQWTIGAIGVVALILDMVGFVFALPLGIMAAACHIEWRRARAHEGTL